MFLRAGTMALLSSPATPLAAVVTMMNLPNSPKCLVDIISPVSTPSPPMWSTSGKGAQKGYSGFSMDRGLCQTLYCPIKGTGTHRATVLRKTEPIGIAASSESKYSIASHQPISNTGNPLRQYSSLSLSMSNFIKKNDMVRHFSSQSIVGGANVTGHNTMLTIKDGLQTRESADDFLEQLTDHQKQLIYHTLNIEILRDKYEGNLGSSRQESHSYLSKFGRPATAKEDPTGTLCEVPQKWLHARLDEKAPPASAAAIWGVALKNALPFVGFGFLDNLIMILAGDYIDITIGTALGISTMAAAALGNAISDVAGIGSAWYVEELASKIGIREPDLTPSQMSSWAVRWACNLGRAFGVVIGCLLGMFPLLFLSRSEVKEKEKDKNKESA